MSTDRAWEVIANCAVTGQEFCEGMETNEQTALVPVWALKEAIEWKKNAEQWNALKSLEEKQDHCFHVWKFVQSASGNESWHECTICGVTK